jgi:hypothetical protein
VQRSLRFPFLRYASFPRRKIQSGLGAKEGWRDGGQAVERSSERLILPLVGRGRAPEGDWRPEIGPEQHVDVNPIPRSYP